MGNAERPKCQDHENIETDVIELQAPHMYGNCIVLVLTVALACFVQACCTAEEYIKESEKTMKMLKDLENQINASLENHAHGIHSTLTRVCADTCATVEKQTDTCANIHATLGTVEVTQEM